MTGMAARLPTPDLFKGLHFDHEVVILCVRWYVTYKLSSRDLVSMMGERGIELAHTTILRWVQRYVPEFEKRWNRYARSVGGSWRCDETYIKVKGRWTYLYRAVDKQGRTVDFLLSAKRIRSSKAIFHYQPSDIDQYAYPAVVLHPGCPSSQVDLLKLLTLSPSVQTRFAYAVKGIHSRARPRV